MGIGAQSLNLTLSLWKDSWFDGFQSVIELGSQDLHCSQDELRLVFEGLLKTKLPVGRVYTAETFYKGMGFVRYSCIDADGRHDALMFDLNKNIQQEYDYNEKYELVTNHGTSEHCFNQYQVFENMHNLCANGGIMLHALPFQGYLNHGFFNYQPCLFRDIATANNYRVIGMYVNIDSNTGDVSTYSDALMGYLHLGTNPTMAIFVVLQKRNETKFIVPYDRNYFGDPKSTGEYQFQKIPTRFFIPEPFEIIHYIRTKTLIYTVAARIYSKLAFWKRWGN